MSLLVFLIMLPLWMLGAFVFVKVIILPMRPPCDTSNRIAHLRLVWWAINEPQKFINQFPWLKRDEEENLIISND